MSEISFLPSGFVSYNIIDNSFLCLSNTLRVMVTIIFFGFLPEEVRAQEAQDVLGEWYTENNRAKIEIYECGDQYCGKIVWLKEPNNPNGTPKLDNENPDPELRSRSIVGTDILTELEYEGDGEWEDGEIYDPESGKTYSCLMELEDENTLEVRGFIGLSLIGRTQTWTRAD